jgi:myo-inositol-1(or 4)-monophosphatase
MRAVLKKPRETPAGTAFSGLSWPAGFLRAYGQAVYTVSKYSAMKIEHLRHIGSMLRKEIPALSHALERKTVLGTGAAGDKSFLVDKKAEEIILSELRALGEPLTIISEEAGILDMRGGGTKVVIDPVDGSRNAVSGIPLYSASFAVAAGETVGDVALSYVINLVNGDEFWAKKGSGAFLNGQALRTQPDAELYLVLYEAQSPARDTERLMPLFSKSRKTRCLGSTALDMAFVSSGAASIFVSPSPSRSFDFAGGWLLVKEAGGVVTDAQGEKILDVPLGLEKSCTLLAAANPVLHEKALSLLAKGRKDV